MPNGDKDARVGSGLVTETIDMPTLKIPCDDLCTWVVVRAGPGRESVSRLKYRSSLCRHEHKPAIAPVPPVPVLRTAVPW